MTDDELRARFEDLSLDPALFSHREHVRLAWTYLRERGLAEVLGIFGENLRRFAVSAGKPGLYHETITWMYLMIIAERIETCDERADFERFLALNSDLLDPALLHRWYEPGTLASTEARRRFIVPEPSRPRDPEV